MYIVSWHCICTQMSMTYYVSRQAYTHMLVNIVSGVISVKSFTMHMFCSHVVVACLMFACILLLVLHRRW